jgi:hypothetical protein
VKNVGCSRQGTIHAGRLLSFHGEHSRCGKGFKQGVRHHRPFTVRFNGGSDGFEGLQSSRIEQHSGAASTRYRGNAQWRSTVLVSGRAIEHSEARLSCSGRRSPNFEFRELSV